MVKQLIALENHADVLPCCVPADVLPQHAVTLQGNRAALDGLQTVNAAQQRAFAAAGRAEQHHHFAALHFEVDAAQGVRCAVELVDMGEGQKRAHAARSRRAASSDSG